jgi:hypothetical protein
MCLLVCFLLLAIAVFCITAAAEASLYRDEFDHYTYEEAVDS